MRTNYFYSLIFALMTTASIAAIAAPESPGGAPASQLSIPKVSEPRSEKVDLNSADAATLQRELAGVGEAKAKAIVTYRDSNGPFSSVDELLEVKGIGKAILERNRDKLELN